MSKIRIVTIICWVVSALVLIGLLVWFLTGSIFGGRFGWVNNWSFGFNFGNVQNLTGPFEAEGTYTVSTGGINSVEIDWVAGEVTLTPHSGTDIQFTEYAQRNLRDNEKLYYRISDGTLEISFTRRDRVNRMPPKRLEVLIPQAMSESMYGLDITTISGRVSVQDFSITEIDIGSVSGAIEIANIDAGNISLESTSGAVNASSVRVRNFDASSVSGAVSLSEIYAAILDASSISGRVEASGEFERVETEAVSGSITIISAVVPVSLNAESVSGSIDVHIPNQGEITVSHSSVSGRFSSDVPVLMQSGAAFRFATVSGAVRIYEFTD